MDPNCIEFVLLGGPVTGPPLGMYPLVPEEVMVTEGFLLCSAPALPLDTMVGAPTEGTDGATDGFPFIEVAESGFPFCTGAAPPTVAGAEVSDTFAGETGFFVAFAYERTVAGAGAEARGDCLPPIEPEGVCDWEPEFAAACGA